MGGGKGTRKESIGKGVWVTFGTTAVLIVVVVVLFVVVVAVAGTVWKI